MRTKKIVSVVIVFILLVTLTIPVAAISESDYSIKEYATSVKEAGTNALQVSGDGMWDLTNPDKSCAIIYKNKVAVKDFKAKFTIDKAYGSGAQDGWYALIFNNKPTFFSCIKPTLVAKQLKGLSFLFKTTSANKKQLIIEVSRYNGSVGYAPVFNQSIFVDLKNDWVINFQMKAGHLIVEGKDLADLNDAIDLSFPTNESYVGFGGFSEQGGPVGFTVEYDPSASKADTTTAPEKSGTAAETSQATTETDATAAATSTVATESSAEAVADTTTVTAETSTSAAETSTSAAENSASSSETEASSPENVADAATAAEDTTSSSAEVSAVADKTNTASTGTGTTTIIIAGLIALVVIGSGIYFLIIRKRK